MSSLDIFTRAALSAAAAVLLAAGTGVAQAPAAPAGGAAASGAKGAPPCLTATKDAVAQGKKIFAGAGSCTTCHGPDARGTPLAPDLTDATWLQTDGSYAGIVKVITTGVAQPKEHPAPMPPLGGAHLSSTQVCALGAYVYSLSHAVEGSK